MATVLVACDPTLGNDHDLVNCICILVATHGDGTLFSHDSFQEEDLVELWVGLGQAHMYGVLQISETEALLTFWSTADMMATIGFQLGAATAWHNKTYKTPSLSSYQHPYQRLCSCEGQVPLWYHSTEPR